jgi:hypothetical protein
MDSSMRLFEPSATACVRSKDWSPKSCCYVADDTAKGAKVVKFAGINAD